MIRKQLIWAVLTLAAVLLLPACGSETGETAKEEADAAAEAAPEQPTSTEADVATDSIRPSGTSEELAIDRSDEAAEGVALSSGAETSTDVPPESVKPAESAPAVDALRKPTVNYPNAPAEFRVRFETTKGNFVVKLVRDWSPRGVDHFHHMVKIGYYQDIAFFRAIEQFMVQFGMHGDPAINELWADTKLRDDPVKVSNKRGYLTFAKTNLPHSRSTQLYINLVDNANLDSYGFAPIGEVIEGMSVVDSLYTGYGEGAPRGRGPSQGLIAQQGNSYLKKEFPNLDFIERVVLLD